MNDHMTFLKEQGAWLGVTIRVDFINELERLITSGGVGPDTKINTVIRVALENIADRYTVNDYTQSREYKNLRHF